MSFGFGDSSQDTSGTSQSNVAQTGTQTGSTARVLTPEQLQSQTQLTQIIHSLATNPQAFLAPAQNQARNQVNDNYSGLPDALRQQFMGNTGGGSSGKYGTAALQGDLARRKSLSDVDQTFATEQSQLPLTAANLSEQLLGMNMGTTSTGTTNNTGTQTGSTTGSQSGSGWNLGA